MMRVSIPVAGKMWRGICQLLDTLSVITVCQPECLEWRMDIAVSLASLRHHQVRFLDNSDFTQIVDMSYTDTGTVAAVLWDLRVLHHQHCAGTPAVPLTGVASIFLLYIYLWLELNMFQTVQSVSMCWL